MMMSFGKNNNNDFDDDERGWEESSPRRIQRKRKREQRTTTQKKKRRCFGDDDDDDGRTHRQRKPDDARAITVFPNLKDSQSTFQLGALRTSAQRLHTLREDIIEKGTVKPGTKEAIERLQNATLDCASARAALEAYSKCPRRVHASIVLKSVSKRFATEDEKATATRRKEAAVMAYADLERLLKDNEKNASAAHLDEGFDAARDALRQFAESVVDAARVRQSAAKAKREEFPELFFKS